MLDLAHFVTIKGLISPKNGLKSTSKGWMVVTKVVVMNDIKKLILIVISAQCINLTFYKNERISKKCQVSLL